MDFLSILFWLLWIFWGLGLFVPLSEPWARAHSGLSWVLFGILGWKVLGGFV